MRRWGPIVLIAVALLSMMVWTQCGEAPIERYEPVKLEALEGRAEKVLKRPSTGPEWSAERLRGPDLSKLGEDAVALAGARPGTHDIFIGGHLNDKAVTELAAALDEGQGSPDSAMLVRVNLQAVLIQSLFTMGLVEESVARFIQVEEETRLALTTAKNLEQWQQAQAVRLLFVENMRAVTRMENWGEGSPATLVAMADRLKSTIHRDALGQVLQRRFFSSVLPAIAEASKTVRPSEATCNALFDEQSEELTQLVSQLLNRHPRAFSPEQTVDSGAEALKSLCATIVKPWKESERVLDQVHTAHRVWTDLVEMLEKGDSANVSRIAEIKSAIGRTENPVGLALLHRERTSWSSLVQSAYVADAQEAVLMLELLLAAGQSEKAVGVLDPTTGTPFQLDASFVRSTLRNVEEEYPFIASYATNPLTQLPERYFRRERGSD